MIKIRTIDMGGGAVAGGGNPPAHTSESAITSKRPISATQATSYASWAGITTAKVGAGKSYLLRITIKDLPADGSVYIALATGKTIDSALAAWNVPGTYQVVVKNDAATDQPLYLLMVNLGTGDTVPTPPQVASVEVDAYDDTYTPDPRSTAPALLQPIKLRDYVQAVLDKHRTGIAWSSDDAAAIDDATGYAGIGVYLRGGETIAQALDMALASYTACKWCDGAGVMRFTRLVDPADETAVGTIDETIMLTDLLPEQDTAPALSTRMGARRNWQSFADGDLVAPSTNFPPPVRQYLLARYQQVLASSQSIAPAYIHARYADPAPSAFDLATDAQTEIDRISAIYATQRWFYSTEIALDLTPDLDVGQIRQLVYPLYGLAQGKNVMVVEFQPDLLNNTATIVVWG